MNILLETAFSNIVQKLHSIGVMTYLSYSKKLECDEYFAALHQLPSTVNVCLKDILDKYCIESQEKLQKSIDLLLEEEGRLEIELQQQNGRCIQFIGEVNSNIGEAGYLVATFKEISKKRQGEHFVLKEVVLAKSLEALEEETAKKALLNYNRLLGNKLKEQTYELNKLSQEVEKFAYLVSHDLKTPLRSIVSFINLIQQGLENDELEKEAIEHYFDYVISGANRMQKLIEDVASFNDLKRKQELTKSVDLNTVIPSVFESIRKKYIHKNIEFTYDTLPIIIFDQQQLLQLFQNLLDNAVKYNESELVQIDIAYSQQISAHEFIIRDNGIGIKTEFHDYIFGMCNRLHNTSRYKGSGLGLSICKKIVEQAKGDISLVSEEAIGSSFFVRLPIKKSGLEILNLY